jgi:hypothetical protein
MSSDILLAWVKEFLKHDHPLEDNRGLPIVDGHKSHKDLHAIIFARNKKAHVLTT